MADNGRAAVSREVELVLLLSTPWPTTAEMTRARELMGQVLDWNQVFGLLMVHRTAALAWHNGVDYGIHDGRDFKPWFIWKQLDGLSRAQHVLAAEHLEQNARLVAELDRRGIPCVLLKGAALTLLGYRALGLRWFEDNDFLFDRAHLTEVADVMRSFGYIQGRWNPGTRQMEPASRREVLLHSVTSHETFPYARHLPDALLLTDHVVDVHFSVDLLTNNSSDDAVRSLLDRRIALDVEGAGPIWTLHQDDMFVFVCVHLQREACNRREVEEVKDLALYKLVDLLALLGSSTYPVDPDAVVRRARQLGFVREVYFALVYLDALFPGRVPAHVLSALRTEPLSYLHEVRHNGTPIHTWRRPIVERFFDPLRQLELTDA
jgi:Uncharacterised nucleotidyltransferase